jgi:hypothetical protein
MKATFHIIKLIAIVLLLAGTANAQSLLTPTELSLAHHAADSSAVTASLAIKGYKPAYSWGNAGHKVSNWLFQTKQGEDYDFKVRKIIEPKPNHHLLLDKQRFLLPAVYGRCLKREL